MTKTILIIDDDKELRRLLKMSLELDGFRVLAAKHGEAAKAVVDDDISLVLTDLRMPVMDGLSFLRWLRNEAASKVPVLVLTVATSDDIRHAALEAGADGVAQKPIGIAELSSQVNGMLAQTA